MTNSDEQREPATAERYRRDRDESVGDVVRGPMTVDNGGRKPIADERCLREIGVGVVVIASPSLKVHRALPSMPRDESRIVWMSVPLISTPNVMKW